VVYERRAKGGWRYNTSFGALIADQHLAATFYEVSPQQATLARPAYSAQNGLVSFRLASSFSRSLTPDWRLFGFARLDTVAGSVNKNSPLVRQNSGVTLGMGVAYTWTRSSELASGN
jgi:outer membrane scaffolding protein for murein synthesis (MipA/OmpV family)